MCSGYSEAQLDGARLRLIDAIPADDYITCRPLRGVGWQSPYVCGASRIEDYREIAEDLALRPTTAENLLDGREDMPNFDPRGEGIDPWTTEEEKEIGGCMLRRALGQCPIYEVKDV